MTFRTPRGWTKRRFDIVADGVFSDHGVSGIVALGEPGRMAQYSQKRILRSISKPLLQRYFESRSLLSDFEWDEYEDGDPAPIIGALDALEPITQDSVDIDLITVNELATDGGSRLIYEDAVFWKRRWAPQLDGMANDCERALLALVEDRKLVERVLGYNEIDRFAESRWQRWTVGKRLQVEDDEEHRDRLGQTLRAIFRVEGYGRRCHIETVERRDPDRFCCFAYPESRPKTDLGYDDQDHFIRHARRTAREIIFVYRKEDGVLEMVAGGDKQQREQIAEAFCKVMLGLKALPDPQSKPPYDLSVLKRGDFTFETNPADNIAGVEIRFLRFDLPGKGYRRLVLSGRATPDVPDVLRALVDEAIDKSKVPLSTLHVSQAKLCFKFRGQNGSRGKSLTFEITYPDRCNLKDHGYDAVAKKYLVKWGIARV